MATKTKEEVTEAIEDAIEANTSVSGQTPRLNPKELVSRKSEKAAEDADKEDRDASYERYMKRRAEKKKKMYDHPTSDKKD